MFDATLRRGFIMTSTVFFDGVPVVIENGLWCVAGDIIINPDTKKINYWYHCWRSVEDYQSGWKAVQGVSKAYQLDGAAYDQAISTGTKNAQGSPIGYELLGLMDDNALATKDVPIEGGEPVSFFEYAERAA